MTGLDGGVHCREMEALFSGAGPVMQSVCLAPALGGSGASALVWFAAPEHAAEAVHSFDSYPYAGCFLEVRLADAGAAARALATLVEVQQAPPVGGSLPSGAPAPLTAPAAAPAIAFAGGSAVPMPPPLSGLAPAPPLAAAPLAFVPAPAPTAAAAAVEPPEFGGGGYNAEDWLAPSDWQPSAGAGGGANGAAAGGWSTAGTAPAKPAAPAAVLPPTGRAGGAVKKAAAPPLGAAPARPEWEVNDRCRIYVQNLKLGVTADALKTYFSRQAHVFCSLRFILRCAALLCSAAVCLLCLAVQLPQAGRTARPALQRRGCPPPPILLTPCPAHPALPYTACPTLPALHCPCRFGQLVDSSVVPKQRIGFLTYAKAESGEQAMLQANATSVSGCGQVQLQVQLVQRQPQLQLAQRQPRRKTCLAAAPHSERLAAAVHALGLALPLARHCHQLLLADRQFCPPCAAAAGTVLAQVPGLSPSGSEPLKLEYRSCGRILNYMTKK